MAKIFITGSSDGVGALTAKALAGRGHSVYLHARNAQRAADARALCPAAQDVLVADLSSTEETKTLAGQLSALGPWDAIVHNAGTNSRQRGAGAEGGLPSLFAVNTLAPYLLTCLVRPPPRRYLFVSSEMHTAGDGSARMLGDSERLMASSYSDSKLHVVMLGNYFARWFRARGLDTDVNSCTPGWVPTKLGGFGAPGNIHDGVATYVLLALGEGAAAGKTGTYWHWSRERSPKADAASEAKQEQLVETLAKMTGVRPPE
ncbi:hypothetical protein SLS62_005829 [Diatrype stigma]|uniref:Uncharacterized protein n=1 Tax=Diatrype stigma TaxID=117547 RepID=A0AAN9UR04_9PEZI